jgi:hypothetical protein
MNYKYKAFGLSCESEIELPAFLQGSNDEPAQFKIQLSERLPDFQKDFVQPEAYCKLNETEFEYKVEGVANYFVKDGNTIFIQALCSDWNTILLYFYSNCMGALLFQRDLIPFHVSGVIDPSGGVWLFGAPSGVGKSTLAIKLKERGFEVFTDDTALIYVAEEKCMALASYPMIKAWKTSLDNQSVLNENAMYQLRADIDKYGVFFHDDFKEMACPVKGIIFMEEEGDEIEICRLRGIEGLERLRDNVYRSQWVRDMGKGRLQFELVSSIAKVVPFWLAKRPANVSSYELFADMILHEVILSKEMD